MQPSQQTSLDTFHPHAKISHGSHPTKTHRFILKIPRWKNRTMDGFPRFFIRRFIIRFSLSLSGKESRDIALEIKYLLIVLISRTPRDLTESGSRGWYISYARTHGSWRGKRTGWGEQHVSRSLVRSSNEESSRVPARRSARSVSTRLAIEQHRDGERVSSFFFSSPQSLSPFFSALRPKRYLVESTSIDGTVGRRRRGETRQRIPQASCLSS